MAEGTDVSYRGLLHLALAIFAIALACAAPAQAEKRIALVIGNSSYRHISPLENPVNDARLMAETLTGLGFELVGGGTQIDLDKAGFDAAVQRFGNEVQAADVALFYYSGHGVHVNGANYLVPVGANPIREADVDFQMLDVALVPRQMEDSRARLKIVMLDACRNNPFGGRGLRTIGRGLAQIQAPEGTLISYATQPGNVALDGSGGNSPYTKALALTIPRHGLDVFQTFNEVGLEVKRATGGRQQPWVSSSPIDGSFFFVPPQTGIAVGALPNAAAASGFSQPQFLTPSSTEQAGGLFTQQDMERVRAIATGNQLLVMPSFKIERPPPEVPATFRRFIGVWASRWVRRGERHPRNADCHEGRAPEGVTGYWVWGSPTAQSKYQNPAGTARISGAVTGDQLTFPPQEAHVHSITATLNRGGDFSILHVRANGDKSNIVLEPVWQLVSAENSAAALPKSGVEPAQAQSSVLSSTAPQSENPAPQLPKAPAPTESLFSQQAMERVRAIAKRNQILVMPQFKIERPAPEVPATLRRFIGVWASNVGFVEGRDRHAMLIVTKVEAPAEAAGYYVTGFTDCTRT
jgi:hypothetical protein